MRLLALLLMVLAVGTGVARAASPPQPLPSIMLWVWERPEDVRFLQGEGAGVAYLAQTLTLDGDAVRVHARQQPIRLPKGAVLLPVTRIELAARPSLSEAQRRELTVRIARLARNGRGVQVDFDAPLSARPFYRALLADVRAALPAGCTLSMTALASWCQGDAWLDDAPVDEVVPMLFRMGPDGGATRARLSRRGEFECAACAGTIGLATDEAPWTSGATRRVYLFSAAPWSREGFARLTDSLPERIRHESTR